VQAFPLQGLSQAARAKAPAHPRTSLGQCLRSGTTSCVRYDQVFDDMQRELVLMTKPKHKNVLMVHGMYARRTRLSLGRPV
jgi:hypothetical protein